MVPKLVVPGKWAPGTASANKVSVATIATTEFSSLSFVLDHAALSALSCMQLATSGVHSSRRNWVAKGRRAHVILEFVHISLSSLYARALPQYP